MQDRVSATRTRRERRPPRRRASAFVGRRWPAPGQKLLLFAATQSRDLALNSWREWFRTFGFDFAGPAEHALFPMVAGNIREHGIESAEIPRLNGLYRYNWSRNQLQFQRVKSALGVLSAGGIETMILKGAALTALGYYDRGSRVMADVDVMVRPGDAERAVHLLEAQGWRRTPERGPPISALRPIIHGIALGNRDGANMDLHWHIIHSACDATSDEPFWAAATPLEFFGEATHAPAPSDLLLHACVHGASWMPAQSFLWITDSLALVRGGNIDWPRVIDVARRTRVTLPLGRALSYLSLAFGAPVPPAVLEDLEKAPASVLERWQYAIEGGSGLGIANFVRDIGRYVVISRGRPASARVRGLPFYLQTVWKLESARQVPLWILHEGSRRTIAWFRRLSLPSGRR